MSSDGAGPDIEALIEASSLGTAEAKEARESVPREVGTAIALAAKYLARAKQADERLAEAWHEGWIAGCDDQQYGDENAEPWTPNPYGATDACNEGDKQAEAIREAFALGAAWALGDDDEVPAALKERLVEAEAALARVGALAYQRDVRYPSKFEFGAAANYVAGYRAAQRDARSALDAPTAGGDR